MNRVFCALLALSLLALSLPAAEAETWVTATVVNCNEWISLRRSPSTQAQKLAEIPLGARVEVVVSGGSFYKCRYDGKTGYALAQYLRIGTGGDSGGNAASAATRAPYESDGRPGELPGWIPALGEALYVVPNVQEFLTLRNASGGTLAHILPGERLRVLGWSDASCRVERVSTGQTGYVNSAYIVAEGLDASRWPYDYSALEADLSALEGRKLLTVESLSTTADGRNVYVIRYGQETARHHMLIQCAMHAREIMTARLGGDLLMMLLADYPEGIPDVCVHIVPIDNPDGQAIALYGPSRIRDAALRASVEGWLGGGRFSDWKANARGVDINRNFDSGWDALTGRTPGSMRYRGEAPHSEAESLALVNYVDRYAFDCTISIHSFGSVIYWLGATGELEQRTRSLADAASEATGYPLAKSESSVEKGGFKDWALEAAGIPSLTLEIGALDSIGTLEEYSGIALRFRGLIPRLVDWIGTGK